MVDISKIHHGYTQMLDVHSFLWALLLAPTRVLSVNIRHLKGLN